MTRFGDIRITARPLTNDQRALVVRLAQGCWWARFQDVLALLDELDWNEGDVVTCLEAGITATMVQAVRAIVEADKILGRTVQPEP